MEYFLILLVENWKKTFSAHVENMQYFLKEKVFSKTCDNKIHPSYTRSLKQFSARTSAYQKFPSKFAYPSEFEFSISKLILSLSYKMATHKFYKSCYSAYLDGEKGFEQGSIQGYLGIWGEFQLHVELIRGQLRGVQGKAGGSCGRWNHTVAGFLWWP